MFAALLEIIVGIVVIVKFIKNILVKYVTHAFIISVQFAITASSIVLFFAFLALTITSLVALYNSIQNLIDYISSGSSAVACFTSVLECSGFLDAFNNGVSLVFVAITGVVLLHLGKFALYAIRFIGNELFKLGVLIGQAVN